MVTFLESTAESNPSFYEFVTRSTNVVELDDDKQNAIVRELHNLFDRYGAWQGWHQVPSIRLRNEGNATDPAHLSPRRTPQVDELAKRWNEAIQEYTDEGDWACLSFYADYLATMGGGLIEPPQQLDDVSYADSRKQIGDLTYDLSKRRAAELDTSWQTSIASWEKIGLFAKPSGAPRMWETTAILKTNWRVLATQFVDLAEDGWPLFFPPKEAPQSFDHLHNYYTIYVRGWNICRNDIRPMRTAESEHLRRQWDSVRNSIADDEIKAGLNPLIRRITHIRRNSSNSVKVPELEPNAMSKAWVENIRELVVKNEKQVTFGEYLICLNDLEAEKVSDEEYSTTYRLFDVALERIERGRDPVFPDKLLPSTWKVDRSIGEFSGRDVGLSGVWKFHEKLGQGSFGRASLYVKFDENGNVLERVVIKDQLIRGSHQWYPDNPKIPYEAGFHKLLSDCQNEHIVKFLGYRLAKELKLSRIYMAQCELGDLGTIIDQHYERWGGANPFDWLIPEPAIWCFFEAMAAAACIMADGDLTSDPGWKHRIIHTDIKPVNFFLSVRTEGQRWTGIPVLKLGDFGIVEREADVKPEDRPCGGGTPGFKAPEQTFTESGDPPPCDISVTTNVWQMGYTVLGLMELKPSRVQCKYGGKNEKPAMSAGIRSGVYSTDLLKLVSQCLHPEPNQRPTARALYKEICDYVGPDRKANMAKAGVAAYPKGSDLRYTNKYAVGFAQ